MKFSISLFAALVLTSGLSNSPCVIADDSKAGEKPATQPAPDAEKSIPKITLPEFEKLMTEKDAVVLDVRTPKEFAAGHVPGAVNIDWHSREFADRVEKLDKSKKYLTYCHAGTRSAAATRKMETLGFKNLFDFSGGWSAYDKAGKPVEK